MDIESGIRGVKIDSGKTALAVSSRRAMRVVSSAVLNGGLQQARSIVNYHVPKDFDRSNPAAFLERAVARLGLPPPTVGMLTGVRMSNLSVQRQDGLGLVVLVTAGLSHPAAAGERIDTRPRRSSTINLIVLVDAVLTDAAMVEAVKTATEAKALALGALDIRSVYSGTLASGTITDSVCVACTGRGKRWEYVGTATGLGQEIAGRVGDGVEDAVRRQDGLERNRSAIERLEERGIAVEDMVEAGMALFAGSRSMSRERATTALRRGLIHWLSDPNIASLMLAAMRLDEDGSAGALPGMTAEAFAADPINLVADEAIGTAIANYVAGTLGVHNFHYYDRKKPGIIGELGPFLDDAVGGLVAGTMSEVLKGQD